MTNSDPLNRYPGSNNPQGQSVTDTVSDYASQAKDAVTDAASQARDKATDYSRSAIDTIDRNRESAASGLSSAANTLRSSTQGTNPTLADAANTVAGKLETSASYIRDHDVRTMASDFGEVVRRNPGPSMVAALAVGFLLGAALRRD